MTRQISELRIVLLVLLAYWGLVPTTPAQNPNVEQLNGAVVMITAKVQGREKVGTGFVVGVKPGEAYVVTAHHVVSGDQQPSVSLYSRRNQPHRGQVVDREPEETNSSLALIRITGQLPQNAA